MVSHMPAGCPPACHILLLCLLPVTVQHLISRWPHLPSMKRLKKDLRGRVSFSLHLKNIKMSKKQPEEWKIQMCQDQEGYKKMFHNLCSMLESIDFKLWGMQTTAGLGESYTVCRYEGCLLVKSAESTRGINARSKPCIHACVYWPVHWQAG